MGIGVLGLLIKLRVKGHRMAKGTLIGDFSLKSTSLALTPGAAGTVVTQGIRERTAIGSERPSGSAALQVPASLLLGRYPRQAPVATTRT